MAAVPLAIVPAEAIFDCDDSGTGESSRDLGRFPASWRLLSDVELESEPDPRYIIDGVLQARGKGFVYGLPGCGKTQFLAQMAVSVTTGRPFYGHTILEQGAVVYLGAEDVGGWKVRLRTAKRAAGLALDRSIGVFTFPEAIDLRDPVSVGLFGEYVRAVADEVPLVLTLIDTYSASMAGAQETSSEDTTTALDHVGRLVGKLGCSVLFAHHTNASGTRERGHSALRGGSDFCISLEATDDLITATVDKNRNGPTGDTWAMKSTPGPDGAGVVLRLASDVLPSKTLTPAQARVYDQLRTLFGAHGATKTEWLKACTGIAERTAYHCFNRLEAQGFVRLVGTHYHLTGKDPV
jgi:hypothetical protein